MIKILLMNIIAHSKEILIRNKINTLKLIIALISILIIIFEANKEVNTLNINATVNLLRSIEIYKYFLMIIFGFLAVLSICLYDFFVIWRLKIKVAKGKVLRISWIANTFNNLLGFAGIIGAGLRTFLYRIENVSDNDATDISLHITPATLVGLSVLSWLALFNIIKLDFILKEHKVALLFIGICALYLPFYLAIHKISWLKKRFMNFHNENTEQSLSMIILICISAFEWVMAGSFLYLLSSYINNNILFLEALVLIMVSSIAGIISLIPGGLGAFDLVLYTGLIVLGLQPHEALSILILYRAFYYLLPWFIGVILSLSQMDKIALDKKSKGNLPVSLVYKAISSWQKVWFNNYNEIRDFGVWALSILVFISGIILISSSAIPGLAYRMDIVVEVTSFSFMKFSHRISIAIGLILLVLSKGIREHIKRAYSLTLGLLLFGALISLMKGLNYEEAIFLFIVAFLLWFTRKRYYRESSPLKYSTVFLYFIITTIGVGFYAYLANEINLVSSDLDKQTGIIYRLVSSKEELIYNAIYAIAIAWTFIIILKVLQPKRPFEKLTTEDDLNKLKEFLKNNEGTTLTHLLFLKDKKLYWAQEDKVVIGYSNIRDKIIVLGDPIGNENYIKAAIEEFQEFADRYALTIAFYEVSEKYLPTYHECGYYFFKLGEEAIIDLPNFSLEGGKKKDLRLVKNRFEKQDLVFQILYPSFSEELLDELNHISDVWLSGRKEKGFSLGWFNRDYIQRSPIAVLKNKEDRVIAFATLMPKYDEKTISIDLMRFAKDVPNGTMDTLFLQIILWYKDRGYEYFNLGMAPLSNVGLTQYAHKQEKIAKIVYNLGNYWYSFSGLRKYKEKFDPVWKPKFLAYPRFISLPALLLDITFLVSRSKKDKQ